MDAKLANGDEENPNCLWSEGYSKDYLYCLQPEKDLLGQAAAIDNEQLFRKRKCLSQDDAKTTYRIQTQKEQVFVQSV